MEQAIAKTLARYVARVFFKMMDFVVAELPRSEKGGQRALYLLISRIKE